MRKKIVTTVIIVVVLFFLILIVRGLMNTETVGPKVAVIDIVGMISRSETVIEQIHQYRDNKDVKAIILRIDSPGGSVAPVQEIYSELSKLNKPIVASMGGTATSGGYYIACAADQIVANPGTLTGSIGVIMQFMKMKGLYDKVGIDQQVVKSGKFKDVGSPVRDLTEEEQQLLQDTIDDVHTQFVDAIFEGRKTVAKDLTREEIAALADGRIFSGNQALAHNLIDRLGNLPDAIELAAELGDIPGKPKIERVKPKRSLLERLLGIEGKQYIERLVNHSGASFRYELHLGE
jgi:protease-4